MATSDNTIETVETPSFERSVVSELSRHDLVLAVIPSVFLVSVLVGHLLSLSVGASIGVASLLGALAVADALFFNPPDTGKR